MTTLVSFLGKVPKSEDGDYRKTTYRFDDGYKDTNKYFGLVLTEKLQPSTLVLMGTSGSMWDVFFEDGSENREEKWLELTEAVDQNRVTQDMLQPFAEFLSEQLGIKVICQLIGYAKNQEEQTQILHQLDKIIEPNTSLIMDVTHGFRHLPLIALVASRYLQTVKNIEVQHIYYGSYVPEREISEVLELKGLIDMLNWVSAIESFDKDGDYGVFAKLLRQEGLKNDDAKQLEEASFFERIMNASDAARKLQSLSSQLNNLSKKPNISPLFTLFYPQLIKRLEWYKRGSLGLQEQSLAEKYFERGDYLRTILYTMEGLISHQTSLKKNDIHDFQDRQEAYKDLKQNNDKFREFKEFRNAMVHGTASKNNKIRNIMKNPDNFKQSIKDRLNHLLKK